MGSTATWNWEGALSALERGLLPEFLAKNGGKEEAKIPVEPRRDLENNWIDVMRGKGTVHCNAELGCATMVAIKMAVESYRQKKTMLWDAQEERVIVS
ncbi:MAG: hypothetical protein U0903_02940 [Planctomycetales bacterium]